VLLHGDFGVNNLYYFPQADGLNRVGIIDFQDLTDARGNMMGSPAFDLMFLMEDVRVEIPEDLENAMKAKFLRETGIKDVVAFEYEYAVIAISQATKCLGLFARLGYGQGRAEYLKFLPYCKRNLAKHLPREEFKNIRNWFKQNNIDI
jgi:aminoglycoside/choline kinase family phosphotransferase